MPHSSFDGNHRMIAPARLSGSRLDARAIFERAEGPESLLDASATFVKHGKEQLKTLGEGGRFDSRAGLFFCLLPPKKVKYCQPMKLCATRHAFPLSACFILIGLLCGEPLFARKNSPPPAPTEDEVPVLATPPQKPRKCRIVVKLFLKTGKEEVSVYYTDAKTKKNCQEQAEVYQFNYTPQLVSKKEVRVEWNHPN